MSEYYGYPENDWRNYLMHWSKGGQAKNHKYISRHKGKNGKWVYVYEMAKNSKLGKAISGIGAEIERRKNLKEAVNDIQEMYDAASDPQLYVNSLVDQGRLSPRNKRTSGGRRGEYRSPSGTLAYDTTKYNNADGHEEREWREKRKKELDKSKSQRSARLFKKFMDNYRAGNYKVVKRSGGK